MTNRDHHHITRRDKIYFASQRALRLEGANAELAWNDLAKRMELLSLKDVPKFDDLYRAIRGATMVGAGQMVVEYHIRDEILGQ